jgi:PAS domain S-box-containing protein
MSAARRPDPDVNSSEKSERKQVTSRIFGDEKGVQQLVEMAPLMMWMSGPDKLCSYLNRSWMEFTGRPSGADLGNGWAENIHPEDRHRSMQTYVSAFDRRDEFKMEYRLRRHDGIYRWLFIIGAPRYSPDRVFEGYIGSCVDITDRKEIESERIKMREQIAQLNRLASMGQLAASLAHELTQPLGAMLSNTQAALRYATQRLPNIDEIREALVEIAEDNRRISAFLETVRAMFKHRELSRSVLDLNSCTDAISRIIRVDALRKGVNAEVNLAPKPVLVMGDRVAVQQVALNLVNNGMDSLQDSPLEDRRLKVSVKMHPLEKVGSVFVEDNGVGIAQEDRAKLFTPFFTTKEDGLGLGLSISRSLIEFIGGRIDLIDNGGAGAVFRVDLPLADTNHTATP